MQTTRLSGFLILLTALSAVATVNHITRVACCAVMEKMYARPHYTPLSIMSNLFSAHLHEFQSATTARTSTLFYRLLSANTGAGKAQRQYLVARACIRGRLWLRWEILLVVHATYAAGFVCAASCALQGRHMLRIML